jgi:hypothetical protein
MTGLEQSDGRKVALHGRNFPTGNDEWLSRAALALLLRMIDAPQPCHGYHARSVRIPIANITANRIALMESFTGFNIKR